MGEVRRDAPRGPLLSVQDKVFRCVGPDAWEATHNQGGAIAIHIDLGPSTPS